MGSCHTTVLPCHCDNPLVVGTVYLKKKKSYVLLSRSSQKMVSERMVPSSLGNLLP
jgi:hypothetical protein